MAQGDSVQLLRYVTIASLMPTHTNCYCYSFFSFPHLRQSSTWTTCNVLYLGGTYHVSKQEDVKTILPNACQTSLILCMWWSTSFLFPNSVYNERYGQQYNSSSTTRSDTNISLGSLCRLHYIIETDEIATCVTYTK